MTQAQVPLIRVFISSPGDVASEREIAQKVIEQMNFDPSFVGKLSILPVAYDTPHNPTLLEATTDPQESVNYDKGLPSECDLVIVIFWKRMGTPLPYPKYQKADGSRYLSGTEWEYLEALEHRKQYNTPVSMFFVVRKPR